MNWTSATVIPEPGGITIVPVPLMPGILDLSWPWANASDEPASNKAERTSPRAVHLAITTTSLEYLGFMYGRTSPGVETWSPVESKARWLAQPHSLRFRVLP